MRTTDFSFISSILIKKLSEPAYKASLGFQIEDASLFQTGIKFCIFCLLFLAEFIKTNVTRQ